MSPHHNPTVVTGIPANVGGKAICLVGKALSWSAHDIAFKRMLVASKLGPLFFDGGQGVVVASAHDIELLASPERMAKTLAQKHTAKQTHFPASKTPTGCDVRLLPAFMDSFSQDFSRISVHDDEDVAQNSPPKHRPHLHSSTFSGKTHHHQPANQTRVHFFTADGIGVQIKLPMGRTFTA